VSGRYLAIVSSTFYTDIKNILKISNKEKLNKWKQDLTTVKKKKFLTKENVEKDKLKEKLKQKNTKAEMIEHLKKDEIVLDIPKAKPDQDSQPKSKKTTKNHPHLNNTEIIFDSSRSENNINTQKLCLSLDDIDLIDKVKKPLDD